MIREHTEHVVNLATLRNQSKFDQYITGYDHYYEQMLVYQMQCMKQLHDNDGIRLNSDQKTRIFHRVHTRLVAFRSQSLDD